MKGVSLVLFLSVIGCAPQWSVPAGAPSLDRLAYAVHQQSNRVRASHGLAPLDWRGGLAGVADRHSFDMARRSYFAHRTPEGKTPADRARQQDVVCRPPARRGPRRVGVAENLFLSARYDSVRRLPGGARQYQWLSSDEIAAEAVSAWMASPGHRANLLDPASSGRGVGVAVSDDHRVYITDVLC